MTLFISDDLKYMFESESESESETIIYQSRYFYKSTYIKDFNGFEIIRDDIYTNVHNQI